MDFAAGRAPPRCTGTAKSVEGRRIAASASAIFPAASLPSVTMTVVLSRTKGAPPSMCIVSGCGTSDGVPGDVDLTAVVTGVVAVFGGLQAAPSSATARSAVRRTWR